MQHVVDGGIDYLYIFGDDANSKPYYGVVTLDSSTLYSTSAKPIMKVCFVEKSIKNEDVFTFAFLQWVQGPLSLDQAIPGCPPPSSPKVDTCAAAPISPTSAFCTASPTAAIGDPFQVTPGYYLFQGIRLTFLSDVSL
jgi:hypothetical protein